MQGLVEQVNDAIEFLNTRISQKPRIGLILGTGLGDFTKQIEQDVTIPYEEIPHFPRSTVESHAGQLVFGSLDGKPLVAMEGRFHFYEGYSMKEVTFPVRVMQALGVDTLIVTNASGGMNPQYRLADIMIIEDQINLMGDNPLRGVNDDRLGIRFPDMSAPYDQELIKVAEQTALELQIRTQTGVFVAVAGPNLETRAEYRMLRLMGADCVGMSTVPECIVANHASMRVLGLSVVTDLCLPDALEPVDISKILAVAAEGGAKLARLIPRIIEQI
ncbi:purine-nucleoside phosphorylase [Gimesia chilikensis]|jgi:purine-nucleoside phosphorylase|uniref:purine-nucleoside phosphorylase n=1 Tax=Gimesia chilikensis TaxID=2605989 RepID=UPI001187FEE9|nr:purine-nucleoside phosphorylase [Gimesia chilikensis]MCR9233603.1 purine-nucleoside phosphorylase [bacterium]QDT83993.1 Purine nucleoside phosphorylase 1 [Gimesia chilikensis]